MYTLITQASGFLTLIRVLTQLLAKSSFRMVRVLLSPEPVTMILLASASWALESR